MLEFTDEAKEVAANIGQFYLQKNKGNHKAAEAELTGLRIVDIKIAKQDGRRDVAIYTFRPGLIIGVKGKNIDALEKWLKTKVRVFESDCWLNHLVPLNFDEL